MTAAEQLELYRSRHLIGPVNVDASGSDQVCLVDGIRVLPTSNGRWRHDPAAIKALVRQAAETGWPK